jgi:carboxylesterase type B
MMKFKSKLLLVILSFALIGFINGQTRCTDDPILETNSGKIRGVCTTLGSGDKSTNIYAWVGVPYAKAPIGDLRFKPPQQVGRWSTIFDATKMKPFCLSVFNNRSQSTNSDYLNSFLKDSNVKLDEDCLYLNIFMSERVFAGLKSDQKAPIVIVFQHGNDKFLNPTHLVIKHDLIVIYINYRLDVFGFLHFNDEKEQEKIEGNQGILDQVTALMWIKDNAENFSGNSSQITLYGLHQAATLIGYHLMLKEKSWPLFKNVIMISGSPVNLGKNTLTSGLATVRAKKFLTEILKCKSGQLVQCALKFDANSLIKASGGYLLNKISNQNKLTYQFVQSAFGPVADGNLIKESAIRAFRKDHFKNCNILIGYKTTDSLYFLPPGTGVEPLKKNSRINVQISPKLTFIDLVQCLKDFYAFYPTHPFNTSEILFNSILSQYTRMTENSFTHDLYLVKSNYYRTFLRIMNDESFACPIVKLVDNFARNSNRKVYLYVDDVDKANRTNDYPSLELVKRWAYFIKNDSPNDPKWTKNETRNETSGLIWPSYDLPTFSSDDTELFNYSNSTRYFSLQNSGPKIEIFDEQNCNLWNNLIPANLDVLGKKFS